MTDHALISWEWIAGFFDGEGHIGVRHNGNPMKVYPRLTLVQSGDRGLRVLTEVKDFLDTEGIWSNHIVTTHFKNMPNTQVGYTLGIGARHCVRLMLQKLLPFLRVKHEEAVVCLTQLGDLKGYSSRRKSKYYPKEFHLVSL